MSGPRGLRRHSRDKPLLGWRIAPLTWAVATLVALVITLYALRTSEPDGLHNLYQIPLALPWFLIPVGPFFTYRQEAFIAAAQGWLNAGLLYRWFKRQNDPAK